MQKEEIWRIFEREFSSYESKSGLEEWTVDVLGTLPDYFWTCAASSTGKHHNRVQNGTGGNLIHTKMNVQVANILFSMDRFAKMFSDPLMRDMIRTALILHDGMKYGDGSSRFVVHEHPVLMAQYLTSGRWDGSLPESMLSMIAGMIASHSGRWTTSQYSPVVLPYPKTDEEYFVHACDYLGSRPDIMVSVQETETLFQASVGDISQQEVQKKKEEDDGSGNPFLDDEIMFVKMLVRGNNWNGKVYGKDDDRFIYLNGIRVNIDKNFLPAFQFVALTGK